MQQKSKDWLNFLSIYLSTWAKWFQTLDFQTSGLSRIFIISGTTAQPETTSTLEQEKLIKLLVQATPTNLRSGMSDSTLSIDSLILRNAMPDHLLHLGNTPEYARKSSGISSKVKYIR